MSRRVAIVQSNYIPWKGYFDLIGLVDDFIVYDEVQYTKNDWRNRNRIKTATGPVWLTIPVATSGCFGQSVRNTMVVDGRWSRRHWCAMVQAYARAPFFEQYAQPLAELYQRLADQPMLSEINVTLMRTIAGWLGIPTRFHWSHDVERHPDEDRNGRLVALCRAFGADEYLSGPAARDYIDEGAFRRAGISVSYMDYSGYPAYPQRGGDFVHQVSVLDLLFNTGGFAPRYMKFPNRCQPQDS